ncbi:MAG: META domain-containing protein [Anaerolineae bacterium]|nr:META domain-containing protein [Anaerolineae bacterium]
MKTISKTILLTIIAALLLAACSPAGQTPSLDGTSWSLIQINGAAPLPDSSATIAFDAGQVGGNSSCNTYQGSYTLGPDNAIEFGMLASTLMACMDGRGDQEAAFNTALSQTTAFTLSGDTLTLLDNTGSTLLVFQSAAE